MLVPFISGSYTGRSKNINSQRSINLFPVVDNNEAKSVLAMYGTPGLKELVELEAETNDTCLRAVHEMGTLLYAIIGNRVYSVNPSWEKTLLGTIGTNTGNVFVADNGTQMIIVDSSATAYYVEAGVLAAITDPDFPNPASATAYQDGYIIITAKDTGKFYISGLYDVTTWSALDFTTAEGDPDYALRILDANRELWVFGEKTIEAFWNSGNTDFPFERIQGSMIEIGTIAAASPTKINGQFYWLTDTRRVVRNTGYQYQIISTPTIEYQIATYAVVDDAKGYTCTIEGHVWYILVFPTQAVTWVYDISTNYWFEWESYYNKLWDTPWSRHRTNCCVRFAGKEIVGDYENGKLYELDMDTLTDNGEKIRRIRTSQFLSKERVNVIYHSFEIEFEAGVGLSTYDAHSADFTVSGTLLTAPNHGIEYGTKVTIAGTDYYVISEGLARDTLEVSATDGGTAVSGLADGQMTWNTMMTPKAMLEWSDDGGHTWSNQHWRSIGQIGQYKNRARWNMLGKSRSRTFRLTITDPVKVVIMGAYAELEALAA